MSYNLIRNARVFFTTNVNPNSGVVAATGFTTGNTREIQVLDGMSFSQNTTTETVTLNEAGPAPVRGQRQFNTALDPVDFSFTTYMRPFNDAAAGQITGITVTVNGSPLGDGIGGTTVATQYGVNTQITVTAPSSGRQAALQPQFNASGQLIGIGIASGGTGYSTGALSATVIDPDNPSETQTIAITVSSVTSGSSGIKTAEENVLWNALFTNGAIGSGTAAWTDGASYGQCVGTNSNVHQLQKFGLIILLDTTTFIIDDCVLGTATIDFGLDAIASIQWAGQGKSIRQITTPGVGVGSFTGTLTGDFTQKIVTAPYLANKLSLIELSSGLTNGTAYTLALTGGSLTIANNVTYLTPANLGIVNQPATYFTGSRAITGTLNCYLRTGSANSAGLMSQLLTDSSTDVDPLYRATLKVGGSGDNRVELAMPSIVLSIPSVNTEQVVSTTITFTAQANDGTAFDIAASNELNVKYYAA